MAANERLCFPNLDSPEFDEAIKMTCASFDIKSLLPDQLKALRQFFSGKDIYFSAPTGYGKSLIFQCLLLMVDLLKDQMIGTSKVLVISPLKALMLDQDRRIDATMQDDEHDDIYEGKSKEELKRIAFGRPDGTSSVKTLCKLLGFDNTVLATHSLKGQRANQKQEKVKEALDEKKLDVIVEIMEQHPKITMKKADVFEKIRNLSKVAIRTMKTKDTNTTK